MVEGTVWALDDPDGPPMIETGPLADAQAVLAAVRDRIAASASPTDYISQIGPTSATISSQDGHAVATIDFAVV